MLNEVRLRRVVVEASERVQTSHRGLQRRDNWDAKALYQLALAAPMPWPQHGYVPTRAAIFNRLIPRCSHIHSGVVKLRCFWRGYTEFMGTGSFVRRTLHHRDGSHLICHAHSY